MQTGDAMWLATLGEIVYGKMYAEQGKRKEVADENKIYYIEAVVLEDLRDFPMLHSASQIFLSLWCDAV